MKVPAYSIVLVCCKLVFHFLLLEFIGVLRWSFLEKSNPVSWNLLLSLHLSCFRRLLSPVSALQHCVTVILRSHFLIVQFFSLVVFLLFCNPLCIIQGDLHREHDWKSELSAAIFCSAQIIWQTFSYSKFLWQHGLTCQESLFLLNYERFVRSVEVFSLGHCPCCFLDGLSAQLCSIPPVPFRGSINHGVWSLCSFPVCPDFCHEISHGLALRNPDCSRFLQTASLPVFPEFLVLAQLLPFAGWNLP